jgi:hypothetical protein
MHLSSRPPLMLDEMLIHGRVSGFQRARCVASRLDMEFYRMNKNKIKMFNV